jgi:hypothetical protein
VQCSNCGHAWFQPGRFAEGAGPEDEAEGAAEASDAGGGFADDPLPGDAFAGEARDLAAQGVDGFDAEDFDRDAHPAGSAEGADGLADRRAGQWADDDDTGHPDGGPVGAVAGPLPSSQLDDEMLAILREEAERETRARRAEGSVGLEMQPDLGLSEGQPAAAPQREPVLFEDAVGAARAAAAEPEQVVNLSDADDEARRGNRRGLLPDIETINSTLRANSAQAGGDDDDLTYEPELKARERGGFRLGFSISLIAGVFLLALYVLAPSMAQQVPALSPALSAYVGAVNEARMWIDDLMRSSTEAMRGS